MTPGERIHVATRKGLFTIERATSGWAIASTQFLGDNCSLVAHDPRPGALREGRAAGVVSVEHGGGSRRELLEEPGPIDWAAAFRAFNEIQYDGWYVYETGHDSTEDCLADTKKNNAFLQKHVQMPVVYTRLLAAPGSK